MSGAESSFREVSDQRRVEVPPLADLSVELGWLPANGLAGDVDRLHAYFARLAPWVRAATHACADRLSGRAPRISTCLLIDDYLMPGGEPDRAIAGLRRAAKLCDLEIDYLARTSGCVDADGVPLVELLLGRIIAEPPPLTRGARPPSSVAGWLTNGVRSPVQTVEAMGPLTPWAPPQVHVSQIGQVFIDAQLWNDNGDRRRWSAALLTALWQLLRLGMLRMRGEVVAQPRPLPGDVGEWADRWDLLPAVIRLNPAAAPFPAYRTVSVRRPNEVGVEHAVHTILNQVAVEPEVLERIAEQAYRDGVRVPPELVDRIESIFVGFDEG
jgi:hypothetical protein